MLNIAGLRHAKVLVLALGDADAVIKIAQNVRKIYPDLKILMRVHNRTHVYDALHQNIPLKHIYRETFSSALNMAEDTLHALGITAKDAACSAKRFKQIDEENILKMADLYHGEIGEDYIHQARKHTKELENILIADTESVTAPEAE